MFRTPVPGKGQCGSSSATEAWFLQSASDAASSSADPGPPGLACAKRDGRLATVNNPYSFAGPMQITLEENPIPPPPASRSTVDTCLSQRAPLPRPLPPAPAPTPLSAGAPPSAAGTRGPVGGHLGGGSVESRLPPSKWLGIGERAEGCTPIDSIVGPQPEQLPDTSHTPLPQVSSAASLGGDTEDGFESPPHGNPKDSAPRQKGPGRRSSARHTSPTPKPRPVRERRVRQCLALLRKTPLSPDDADSPP
eukprot:EG_transcript_9010